MCYAWNQITNKKYPLLNIIEFLKYVIRSASYGVVIAIALLLLVPSLRDNNYAALNIFQSTAQQPKPLSYARAVHVAGPAVVNIYSEEIQTNATYGGTARKSTKLCIM